MSTKDLAELRGILVQLDRGELLGKGGVNWALKEIEDLIAAQVAAAQVDGAIQELGVTLKNFDKIRKSYKGFAEYADERIARLTTDQKEEK